MLQKMKEQGNPITYDLSANDQYKDLIEAMKQFLEKTRQNNGQKGGQEK